MKLSLLILFFSLTLIACGGSSGGGSSNNNNNSDTSTPITAVALSPSSVYISWAAVAKATSYKLCFDIGITPAIDQCPITDISNNFYTHNTNLTANTTYHYKVIAVNEGGNSGLSTAEAITTTFLSGQTVADFAHVTTAIEKEAIYLTWTGYANATAYNLYYEVQPITSTTAVADALSTKVTLGNVTNYKLTDLASNAVYGLKIQAVTNSGGITDLGNGIIAAPLATTLALGKNTVAGSSTVSVVYPGIDLEVHRSETANCDLANTSSCASYYTTTITTQGTGFIDNHTTTSAYYKLKTNQGISTNSVQINTAATRFSDRYYHQVVVFKNEFYLIGGYDDTTFKNDVWKSSDGANWTQVVTTGTIFSVRAAHQVIVWNNELYLIGGRESSGYKNDVWKSSDGITWTEVTANAAFPARYAHQVVVWNNELYLIGGNGVNNDIKNDVWKSADGVNWTEVTANAAFPAREAHQVVVWNNVLYLLGGQDNNNKNDVWKSTDGANWTQVVTTVPIFSARENHQVVVWNNKFYLIGGHDGNDKNDVWKSADGVNWTEVTANAAFSHREYHQVIVWNNELYLLGGNGFNNNIMNDVWKSSDGALWFEMFPSQPITW